MATTLNLATPGVYIQEIPVIPSSIVSVPTAVPVFVGYTAQAMEGIKSLHLVPWQIDSLLEYTQYFGAALDEPGISVTIDATQMPPVAVPTVNETARSKYLMYYAVQNYFANGGGTCYILSVGAYSTANMVINLSDFIDASGFFRPELEKYTDITLVVCPDALGMPTAGNYYSLQSAVIAHCVKMQNRLAVMDVYRNTAANTWQQDVAILRNEDKSTPPIAGLVVQELEDYKFAAVYFPRIKTTNSFQVNDSLVNVTLTTGTAAAPVTTKTTLDKIKGTNSQAYYAAENAITNNLDMLMPAAPAMVGIYAAVDDSSGVWKAPANVAVLEAVDLEEQVSSFDQGQYLNIDPVAGLSINAIRSFPGRGPAIVWGARTLAGNDNEWRYIPVRRFFFMAEQSIKNAIEPFVFEPNDNNTWTRVTAMIVNYLTELWKAGALMGSTTKDAFFVQVGLGVTMTAQDVLEGRMIVQVGMAAVRPAEFIILQFLQMMPAA
jgi:phage tail sheath protein FI